MRILVCGDRKWSNEDCMRRVLEDLDYSVLIHGDATGADRMSQKITLEDMNYKGEPKKDILVFPAPWDDIEGKPEYQLGTRKDGSKYWKAAGNFRNRQMLTEGKPELVLAFYDDIAKSKGTLDMIKAANKAGVEVRLYAR